MASPAEVRAALADAHHSEWGTVFGSIVRLTGDWSLAEDSAQDAFARALVVGRETVSPAIPEPGW